MKEFLVTWLINNYRKIDQYFAHIYDLLLGQELSTIPFTMINRDESNTLWIGNKTSCYPDIPFCTLEEILEYTNLLFKDNLEALQWWCNKFNEIPIRFELPDEITFGDFPIGKNS